ncbi:MAG: DUF6094 domain-containing protein, partial [Pseudomonadota bacterium]|nr:DUF6094 domain-containing protein [Pseudomonadota bacterium]
MAALMFQRLARNFAKAGYFPTDADTLSRILSALEPCAAGSMRILDPCCGEGVALAECQAHLGAERVEAFGVEYDEDRAWHAKSLLNRCIHGDFQTVVVGRRQFGLLFLNPPYGDLVSDRSGALHDGKGRKRLEKLFYGLAHPLLAFGGVMVLIVPQYALDREFCALIANHFDRVRLYRAPERQFKQVVVFGVRKRTADAATVPEVKARLEAAVALGETLDVLPEHWPFEPYRVPAAVGEVKFVCSAIDPRQLAHEVASLPSLWPQFGLRFGQFAQPHRRPLRALSRWHLALALAAGQVSGAVASRDGRVYVVKGDTHKEKDVRVELEHDADGTA